MVSWAKVIDAECDLESLSLPNSLTSIGAFAFNHCCELTSIQIAVM